MPTRLLRDGILDSEAINSLSEEAELFYRRLMSLVDDFGRYDARPEILRAKLFALQLDRWPLSRVGHVLAECGKVRQTAASRRQVPLVSVYEVDGAKYLEISNFGQRTRSNSKFPPQPADKRPQPADIRGHSHAKAESESYADAKASAETARAAVVTLPQPVDYGARYRALYERHIIPGYIQDGEYEYGKAVMDAQDPEKTADVIDAAHAEWMRFYHENPNEYTPGIGKWIKDGYWMRKPKPKARDSPPRSIYVEDKPPSRTSA